MTANELKIIAIYLKHYAHKGKKDWQAIGSPYDISDKGQNYVSKCNICGFEILGCDKKWFVWQGSGTDFSFPISEIEKQIKNAKQISRVFVNKGD